MFLAVARHREKRNSAMRIGEKCQGEKNKYNFFLFVFFDQYERKINYSRQERTYLTSHRVSFFSYSISSSTRTDGRRHATSVLNTINRSFIRTEYSPSLKRKKKENEHVFHTIFKINENRK
jgi:hypothetical protein